MPDLDLNNLTDDMVTDNTEESQNAQQQEQQEQKAEEQAVEAQKTDQGDQDTELTADEIAANLEKELKNLETRYESSSKEGKRLNSENEELKKKVAEFDEVKPVLDVLASNPELQDIAKQMIQGTYHKFDGDLDLNEALRDPNSDSGKALKSFFLSTVTPEIQKLKTDKKESATKEAKYEQLNKEIESVAKEMELDDTTVDNVLEFAKSKGKVNFKDMVTLYRSQNGEQTNVSKILDQIKQLDKTSKINPNIKGAGAGDLSMEDKVAKLIREAGGEELTDLIP